MMLMCESFHLRTEREISEIQEKQDVISDQTTYFAEGCCRLDRNSSFCFQLHRVHYGTDAILSTNIVNRTNSSGVKEDTFRQRGLSTVNVSTDSNVSNRGIVIEGTHPSFGVLVKQRT